MADLSDHPFGEAVESLPISSHAITLPSQQPGIMRLPLELRRMIYRRVFSFTFTKRQDRGVRDIVYSENPQEGWIDRPFPLFHINKQIHAEICDFLPPIPACIRITGRGMGFDILGLASAAAQGFHDHKDLGKLSHIMLKIWPPHRDRPVEMLYIWNHVRRLRDMLQKCERIQKLTIRFENKRPFGRYDNCLLKVCQRVFGDDTVSPYIGGDDETTVVELFAVLTNVTDAQIVYHKPGYSLEEPPSSRELRTEQIKEMMMGIRPPSQCPSEVETYEYTVIERFLKLCSSQMPLDKLLSRFSNKRRRTFNGYWENTPRWDIESARYDASRMGLSEDSKGPWFRARTRDEHMRRWVHIPYEYKKPAPPIWTWAGDELHIVSQQDLDESISHFMQESFGN
ncbi:MAG: hypothetical protein Q9204_002899 [Flavoplaca sp. TL-2023a]